MKTVGIIAEYNPFHNGHKYQIEYIKQKLHADHIVVVMSGDFVQRGTPAFIDKYSRTQMALELGVDIIFELPVFYATASAEGFAMGGVSLLHNLGFVDQLCFGCENDDLELLETIAEILVTEPKEFSTCLQAELQKGNSYPTARQKALQSVLPSSKNLEKLLMAPNNILAIEYLKALKRLNSNIQPVPLLRKDADYHNVELSGSIVSASAIRTEYFKNKNLPSLSDYLPSNALEILSDSENKTFPITTSDLDTILYYKLSSIEDFTKYLDVTPDIENKMKKLISPNITFQGFVEQMKTKNLTHSRVSRILLHILLDIRKNQYSDTCNYARILGLRKTSSTLLKNVKNFPIITKVATAEKQLNVEDFKQFQLDLFSSHLYQNICYKKFRTDMPTEPQHSPIILD